MDQIQYAGNTLVTGSDIAHAVLSYAQALASNGDSDTVMIPVQHDDGSVVKAEILIGPASQLISEPYESSAPEIEDAALVRRLKESVARLQKPRAVAEDVDVHSAIDSSEFDDAPTPLDG